MLKGTINFRGKTESDLLAAIDEARRLVEDGNTSGWNSNDDGSFTFHIVEGEDDE